MQIVSAVCGFPEPGKGNDPTGSALRSAIRSTVGVVQGLGKDYAKCHFRIAAIAPAAMDVSVGLPLPPVAMLSLPPAVPSSPGATGPQGPPMAFRLEVAGEPNCWG